jgi:GR25 family glycosyltransferase involved in LPS biosynthesis
VLKPSQRSVVMKHHSAVYDAVRRNYSAALILEDDAFLRANFRQRLREVMAEVPPGFDIVWVGGCMKMHAWRRKFMTKQITKHVYEKAEARCAHAYIVSQAGARKLLQSFPLTLPIDFQMTSAMREHHMRSYWVEPFLSVQGNVGGCVTNDLGAGCVSVSKYDVAFDVKFADVTRVDALWHDVPAFHSKR